MAGRQGFELKDLMDVVQVKNRIKDGSFTKWHDSKPYTWGPGEVVSMARGAAEWFVDRSIYGMNQGDPVMGIPAKHLYRLCIVGSPGDEGEITMAMVRERKELLDAQNMPELTRIDPATGEPMKRVYIDPRGTGAMSRSDELHRKEQAVTQKVSKAIIRQGANDIAEAVEQTGADDAEIETAVKTISGKMEARA